MKPQRFKKNDKVRIVRLNYDGFTAKEEENWDEKYLDKIGIIQDATFNAERNYWEHYIKIPDSNKPKNYHTEAFYDYELDFAN